MKMNSARQLWHDAYYQRRESTTSYALEVGMLQASIQKTEKDRRTDVALDQALCGMVQSVIGTLPASLQCFGHWMYSPLADDDHREIAEELVFAMAAAKLPRMTEAKREKAQYVAKGVLYRYRRQHQGGQSSTPDPLPTPEAFRAWMFDEYGVRLCSENWTREWESHIDAFFQACNDMDKAALAPVSGLLYQWKDAA